MSFLEPSNRDRYPVTGTRYPVEPYNDDGDWVSDREIDLVTGPPPMPAEYFDPAPVRYREPARQDRRPLNVNIEHPSAGAVIALAAVRAMVALLMLPVLAGIGLAVVLRSAGGWLGGAVPGEGDRVAIAAGAVVLAVGWLATIAVLAPLVFVLGTVAVIGGPLALVGAAARRQ
jgi:uncharacterized protein involved in cysteine biosynthesis